VSVITDQWTGNGLADATAITSGNVATAGNFTGTNVTWTRAASGSPTQETVGDGFKVINSVTTDVARIDGTLASSVTALRAQLVFTPHSSAAGSTELMIIRNSTTSVVYIRYDGATRVFTIRDASNSADLDTAGAITAGDEITIDVVAALHASPTTSNGRVFVRYKNNTDTGWNTTGYRFYDSLYTKNLGITNFTVGRWGKTGGTGTMSSPGSLWEFCGIEPQTVNPADTSEQDASAYFADNPTAPYSLESGSITAVTTGLRLG